MHEYLVRPSGKEIGKFGVYKITGHNKATEIYTGTESSCYNYQQRLETERITRLDLLNTLKYKAEEMSNLDQMKRVIDDMIERFK